MGRRLPMKNSTYANLLSYAARADPVHRIPPIRKLPVVLNLPQAISLAISANRKHPFRIPPHPRGAHRDRHEARGGLRWTRGSRLTSGTLGGRAKSCGPGAPKAGAKLATMLEHCRLRRWQSARFTEEITYKP